MPPGWSRPTSWAYDPNAKPQYDYSPSKANQVLDEAGWTKGSDGMRSKSGTPLAFTLHYPSGSLTLANVAQVIQQNWKAVGCNLTPVAVQFTEIVTEITETRDYDIIVIGFNFTNDPDQSQLFSSSGVAVGGFNGMDFTNSEIDKLLNEGTTTLNKDKRIAIYKQYQNLMQELVPIHLLYFSKQAYGTLSTVHGMQLNTFQQYARPWMNKVWVSSS